MEKERRIKAISVVALIVAVLGLTVAFAALSANLTINGTAKVNKGKWDIYFENLSEPIKKGKVISEDIATISDNDKTKIQDINVTLTQPKDEIIYTVELINDGDIDAEISSIVVPSLDQEAKKYLEFSAMYDDKKEITKGDILKGGTTENVTISIKFKEDVTELPKDDLHVTLSYEINYVQSNSDSDENVHKGEMSSAEYISLEYIESTGTQYIDTRWIPSTDNARIKLKYVATKSVSGKAVCGSENVGYPSRWLFVLYGQTNLSNIYPLIGSWNNKSDYLSSDVGQMVEIDWKAKDRITTLNNAITKEYISDISAHKQSLKIFQNLDNQKSSIKLYYFKIYDNDILVRDFIPVIRISDDAVCLYDKVSNTFFENQGTEDFISGNIK